MQVNEMFEMRSDSVWPNVPDSRILWLQSLLQANLNGISALIIDSTTNRAARLNDVDM